MKNGKIQMIDTRTKKTILDDEDQIHKNGISQIDVDKSKQNFYTNGRDDKIKYFDFRNLQLRHKGVQNELNPVWVFDDHVSMNFNINPCFLGENDNYIVTGSKENIVNFYFFLKIF